MPSESPKGIFADINGHKIYFERYGKGNGRPLVLLHGGLNSIQSSFKNRVIPNFVALCNKLVFCSVFTWVGLKNQVGWSDFTLGRQHERSKRRFKFFGPAPTWRSEPCLNQYLASCPGIQLVPANGKRAIAAASTVRATRSSRSKWCTFCLPQARAIVVNSMLSVLR